MDTPGGLLGPGFRSSGGLPVVNLAGCPTHPGWIVDTLEKLAFDGLTVDALDEVGRPLLYAEQLVHHGCPKNEFYEFKASAEKQGMDLLHGYEPCRCHRTGFHQVARAIRRPAFQFLASITVK